MKDKQYLIDRMTINMETECWEWDLYKGKDGYGRISKRNNTYQAHRLSWETFREKIPKEKCILHHCDNPKCINPNHLYIGTHQDNMDDMVRRGRQKNNPTHNNNFAGKQVMANGILYTSYTKAGKALGISGNGIKKRIKLGWEGYSMIN